MQVRKALTAAVIATILYILFLYLPIAKLRPYVTKSETQLAANGVSTLAFFLVLLIILILIDTGPTIQKPQENTT